MLWSEYLAEEIFTDSSSWTIAAGCVGTRTGLGGQAKRCNLDEFVRHLWMQAVDENGKPIYPTEKNGIPKQGSYVWDIDVTKADTMGQEDVAKAISDISVVGKQKMVPVKGPDGRPVFDTDSNGKKVMRMQPSGTSQKGTKLKPGFTGWLNAPNVNGEKDYWNCMKKAGNAIAKVNAKLATADDATKKKFQFHIDNAMKANDRTVDLREQEMGKNMLSGETSLSSFFDKQPVLSSPRTGPYGTTYDWPDKDKTCNSDAAKAHFGDATKAGAAWDNAMAALYKADDDGAHQKAVDAIRSCKSGMTGASACGI